MYTQCSQCETVFKLSAEMLRAAGGQVRCGKCGNIFNALFNLAEERSAFPAAESQLSMEKRADTILESAPEQSAAPAESASSDIALHDEEQSESGVEIAHLEITDIDLADFSIDPAPETDVSPPPTPIPDEKADAVPDPWPPLEEDADPFAGVSLEFTLPPGELDRIFVESKRSVNTGMLRGDPPPMRFDTTLPPITADDIDILLPAPDEIDAAFDALAAAREATPASEMPPERTTTAFAPTERLATTPRPSRPPPGLDVPEEVRSQILAAPEPPSIDSLLRRRRRTSPVPWICAAVVLTALLAIQIVHQNREWLAAQRPVGSVLREAYALIGQPIALPANLGVYQLRQWGVTGDPTADGTLRVRASILNVAPQLQPYPLLRVNLANRFGTRIGARDFDAGEYLGHPVAGMLKPGERVDATMEILDPGRDAEGFDIDVCLRGADKKISCANDLGAAHTK